MAIFWTIQAIDKWRHVQERGMLQGDESYIDEDFLDAYKWMIAQMKQQLPNYIGEVPIWLWTKRPDLRSSGYLEKGQKGVLLQVELDPKNVLLSDFQAWHLVLNNHYMSLTDYEDKEVFTDEEIQKSWALIFELEQLKESEMWGEPLHLQGVTGTIKLNQIKSVKEFTAR